MTQWKVGDRVVWPHEVKRGRSYVTVRTSGTVIALDLPGVPRGVQVEFDSPINGADGIFTDTCYATYEELEPEDLQASRVSEQAASPATAEDGNR